MSDAPYYYLVGNRGLTTEGALSGRACKWKKHSAAEVDAHLVAGTRPAGMKSGDFHVHGSYRFNTACGNRSAV